MPTAPTPPPHSKPTPVALTTTVNIGNVGVPWAVTARSHGGEPEPGVSLSFPIFPNVFVIEYIHVFVGSKATDEVSIGINDAQFLLESVGLHFDATPAKGGFVVDKMVKIPVGKQLDISIRRTNMTGPDVNNLMSYQLVITGSLQTP